MRSLSSKQIYETFLKALNSGAIDNIKTCLASIANLRVKGKGFLIEYHAHSSIPLPSYKIISRIDKRLFYTIIHYYCGNILQALLTTAYYGNNLEVISKHSQFIIDMLPANESAAFFLRLPAVDKTVCKSILIKIMQSNKVILDEATSDALARDSDELLDVCIAASISATNSDKNSFLVTKGAELLVSAANASKLNCIVLLLNLGVKFPSNYPNPGVTEQQNFTRQPLALKNPNSFSTNENDLKEALKHDNTILLLKCLSQRSAQERKNIISILNSGSEPILHRATLIGSLGCINILLQYGANPLYRDKKGMTSLEYTNNLQILKLFIHFNKTLLNEGIILAASRNNINLLFLCLTIQNGYKDTDINISFNGRIFPLLHYSAFCGSVDCVKLLLELGISPNTKDSYGCTAKQYTSSSLIISYLDSATQTSSPSMRF